MINRVKCMRVHVWPEKHPLELLHDALTPKVKFFILFFSLQMFSFFIQAIQTN